MISLVETSERLSKQGISLYKISEILGEPKSTIQNMFSGRSKYADRKVESILKRINSYLDKLESSPETTVPVNPDLSLKLFKLGLDSKSFTPEEKLQLALAHKKLTESKNQKSIKEFLQEFIMTTQSADCKYTASQILKRDKITFREFKMIIEWGFLS